MIDQITENVYISDAASVLYNSNKLHELKVSPTEESFLKTKSSNCLLLVLKQLGTLKGKRNNVIILFKIFSENDPYKGNFMRTFKNNSIFW